MSAAAATAETGTAMQAPAARPKQATAQALAQSPAQAPAQALIGTGTVRHRRLRPTGHTFAYPTYFLMLPMRTLRTEPSAALRRNRFGFLSFHDSDHGAGGSDALAWLEQLLQAEGVADADGEVWLHTYPRVLGYAFKPVSFWYCHRADGTLAAAVVEVNNTFGERHCYLLHGPALAYGREQTARKVFHVSPFCQVQGNYRFRFVLRLHPTDADGDGDGDGDGNSGRTLARVDHDDDAGPLLQTSVSGSLQPLTAQRARAAFFGMPLMTLGVLLRIHLQALRLWRKRVPFIAKPAPPASFVSR